MLTTVACISRRRMAAARSREPTRCSHPTSCQLTNSPSTGKARVNRMDRRRGEFTQDTNRQGNKIMKIILTRC